MPTYYTPSPSTSPSPSSSLSSAPKRFDRPHPHRNDDPDEKPESLIKSSLVFLGSVAAAALCAHRFWPKGFTYGEREDWEIREETYRRNQHHHHRHRGSGEKEKHGAPAGRGGDRGARREGYRRRGSHRDRENGGVDPEQEEGTVGYVASEKPRRSRTREGSRSRDRSRGRSGDSRSSERHGHRGRTGSVRSASRDTHRSDKSRDRNRDRDRDRDRAARRESRYYPPAPQRYAIDRAGSRRSSLDSSTARSRKYYYPDNDREGPVSDREEAELVYARREKHTPRSRRSSVDGGSDHVRRGRSRYSDGLYYGD